MPVAKLEFVFNKKDSKAFSNKNGTVFVKGELPELYRGRRERDCQIKMDAASQIWHCGALIVSGTDAAKVSSIIESNARDKFIIVCFGGVKDGYTSLKNKHGKSSTCLVLRLVQGMRYRVWCSWEGKYSKSKLLLEEEFAVPKKEKKNADVSVQKPNKPKKANQ